jgi:hypothetical protein
MGVLKMDIIPHTAAMPTVLVGYRDDDDKFRWAQQPVIGWVVNLTTRDDDSTTNVTNGSEDEDPPFVAIANYQVWYTGVFVYVMPDTGIPGHGIKRVYLHAPKRAGGNQWYERLSDIPQEQLLSYFRSL